MSNREFEITQDTHKPKCYVLDMFPYPSGEGLHMGHVKVYTASDIYARYKRMKGFNVLHPTGFDAFGLPAEQFALKNKIHPRISTDKNISTYLKQMKALNFSYDYDRVIDTTDHNFYKWTQWIFKQIYKKGLAYESHEPINWCPSCKTGLANEDLEGNTCERCGTVVEKKPLRQWVLKITDYADRLVDDLDTLSKWPQSFIDLEKNWIGRSEGAEFEFKLTDVKDHTDGQMSVKVFTTRADTLFGVTFVAISAEMAQTWLDAGWETNKDTVSYITKTLEEQKKENDYSVTPEKTGVYSGVNAINPATGEKVPVWIANYVVGGVGTGALMGVPAHDERDNEFAKKYDLPIVQVILPETGVIQKDPELRKSIVAILWNKKDDTFLSIDWGKEMGGNLFVGGGLENDEDIVACATREIREETGYTSFTHCKSTGIINHNYFAHSKNVARRIQATGLLFELTGDEKVPQKLEENEKNKFTVTWLSRDQVKAQIQDELHALVFDTLVNETIYTGNGTLTRSASCDGLTSDEAKIKIIENFGGKKVVRYKLQDWVFARQRYWGEPFPIVFDENHISYVVADSELPVKLPDVKEYEPTGTGESPLFAIKDWVEVYGYLNDENEFISCKKEDPRAKMFTRETNTMPQWAGSSWYYLRFIDPHNEKEIVNKSLEEYWQPVDVYVGGAEHATRHLIYARFWHKFLYDIGIVSTIEPFTRLESVGLILGEGGVKMSKRLGNVINPDDVINEYGPDVARMYVMFMGPFGQSSTWDSKSIQGIKKFLDRVVRLKNKVSDIQEDPFILSQSIKKIGDDIEDFKFNTSISQLMILLNYYEDLGGVSKNTFSTFLKLLAPFAPHITEQLWSEFGENASIHLSTWPVYDDSKLLDSTAIMAIQIAGKMRGTIEIQRDSEDSVILEMVKKHEMYQKYVGQNEPKKVIIVKNKVVNIVI